MRSRNSLTLLLVLTVLSCFLAVLAGCSSDNKTPTGDVVGSISDPDYLVVKDQVDAFIDSTLVHIKSGFTAISSNLVDTLVDPVIYGPINTATGDSASSLYSNGWHVIYISRLGGGYSTARLDSIQYRDFQNNPQQDNANIRSMTFNHKWVFSVFDTTYDHSRYNGEMALEYVALNTEQASISGSNSYHSYSKDYSSDPEVSPDVSRDIVITGNLYDFYIQASNSGWSHSCPNSGTITGTVEMVTYENDADPQTINWTFTLKFTNGELDYSIRRGSIYWHSEAIACSQPEE